MDDAFMRRIADATPCLLFVYDVAGRRILYANRAALAPLGCPADELRRRGLTVLRRALHPEDRRALMRNLREQPATDDSVPLGEYRFRDAAGPWRWFEVQRSVLAREAAGRVRRVLATAVDVTARKAAEQALVRSRELYRAMFESTTDRIVIVDRDRRHLYVNQAALDAMGMRREDVVGRTMEEVLGHMPEFLARWTARIDEVARSGRTLRINDELVRGGQTVLSESVVSPMRDATGQVFAVGLSFRDVTQQKRAEMALREMHRRLMTARDEHRRSLARELHDSIGQELTRLQWALQGMLADAPPGEPGPTALREAVEQCGALIHEVRNISHGLYPPTLESLGLVSALKGLASDFRGTAEVTLHCASAEGLRFSKDVEVHFFRVAQEAMSNALRHGHARHVRIELSFDDVRLRLVVEDDGTGFEPAPPPQVKGLGLLAMTERIEALGGTLDVASQPGRTRILAEAPVHAT